MAQLQKKRNALVTRMRDHADDYLRFARDLRVPFDNNQAEQGSLIMGMMGRPGEPDYRSSARNRLGSGGMMRPPAGCPAVARAGEMMAACRRRTTSR